MKVTTRLIDYLEKNKIHYEILHHARGYTALDLAREIHNGDTVVAKAVMIKADGGDVMAVIPATTQLDLFKAANALNSKDVRVEREVEFKDLFPDCETGAMPPFGSLYKIPCHIDASFAGAASIVFNAGGHEDSVKMKMEDYFKIMGGRMADLAVPRK